MWPSRTTRCAVLLIALLSPGFSPAPELGGVHWGSAPDPVASEAWRSSVVSLQREQAPTAGPVGAWASLPAADPYPNPAVFSAFTGAEILLWGDRTAFRGNRMRYTLAADRWETIALVGAPPPGQRITAVWTEREMVVWVAATTPTAAVLGAGVPEHAAAYDPRADTWRALDRAATPRFYVRPAVAWTGAEVLVWGGESPTKGTSTYSNAGHRFYPDTDRWEPMADANAPCALRDVASVWTGREFVVWGNCGIRANTYATGGAYDPRTDTWRSLAAAPVSLAPSGQGAVWTGEEMLIWGWAPGAAAMTVLAYAPARDSWRVASAADAPTGAGPIRGVWTGSHLVVFVAEAVPSSRDGGALQAIAAYDPISDVWSPVPFAGLPAGFRVGAVETIGESIWLWGGTVQTAETPEISQTVTLRLGQAAWQPRPAQEQPLLRGGHSAVWTGSEMIVWGGAARRGREAQGTGHLATGGRLEPRSGRWSPVATIDAPLPREDHAAVWTGSEMLIWGGRGDQPEPGRPAPVLADGARYDPARDQWRPMAAAAPLSPRQRPFGAWTGERMLIWGGSGASRQDRLLQDGALYDPLADSWSPVADIYEAGIDWPVVEGPGVASAAGWNGRELIVLFAQQPASGAPVVAMVVAAYDPGANSWRRVPEEAPDAPHAPAAANGAGNDVCLWLAIRDVLRATSSGICYGGARDAWHTIPQDGAPGPRSDVTGVQVGSQFVGWGYQEYPYPMSAIGAIYDPRSRQWAPLPTVGEPPAGSELAVWTGEEIIVWGGDPRHEYGGARLTLGNERE